jgi:hypothetical protein
MTWVPICRLIIIGVDLPYLYEKHTDMDFLLNVVLQSASFLFTFIAAVNLVKSLAARIIIFLLFFSAFTATLTWVLV